MTAQISDTYRPPGMESRPLVDIGKTPNQLDQNQIPLGWGYTLPHLVAWGLTEYQ